MADREKVIRAVDSCFDYWLDQHRYIHPLELETVRERKAEALALLKEQEPVKPIPYHRSDGTIFKYECRKCRTKIFKNDQFCRRCGRSVKWE